MAELCLAKLKLLVQLTEAEANDDYLLPICSAATLVGARHLIAVKASNSQQLQAKPKEERVCVCVLGFYRRVSISYDYLRLGTDF